MTRPCNPEANEALALLLLKATVELARYRQSNWGLRSKARLSNPNANEVLALLKLRATVVPALFR